jgi:DNA-binding NtrC family response regulator
MALARSGFSRVSEILKMVGFGEGEPSRTTLGNPAQPGKVAWNHPSRPIVAGVRRKRVLIVSESDRLANVAAEKLDQHGYEVHVSESFSKGEIALRSSAFDLVIVDQGSPCFEGRPVVEQAIAIDRYRPVLVVTSCVNMRCYLDAMCLGATDYLETPRSADQWLTIIRKFMAHTSAA